MHSVLLARFYWTSDLQSRESKGKLPDEGGKQALLTYIVWTPKHTQDKGKLKITWQAGSKIYTALPCRHTLMLKQHRSRDGSVGSGAANIYTITHSERHILLQLQKEMLRCVSSLKKHTVLPSGTRLFHWVRSKMCVQHSPVDGISSQQVLLLFQGAYVLWVFGVWLLEVQNSKPEQLNWAAGQSESRRSKLPWPVFGRKPASCITYCQPVMFLEYINHLTKHSPTQSLCWTAFPLKIRYGPTGRVWWDTAAF